MNRTVITNMRNGEIQVGIKVKDVLTKEDIDYIF